MKTWIKLLIIFGSIILAIAIAVGIFMYFQSDRHGENLAVKNEKLNRYEESSGGDMLGSHHSRVVKRYDDKFAIVSILNCEWHADDGYVEEYYIDNEVLDDIESIFKRNNMQSWAHKQISNIFVADGASYSYSFYFGDTSISFSSQVYPPSYQKHLNAIDEVIKNYSENKQRIPGLVLKEKTQDDEYVYEEDVTPGEITFDVYRYMSGVLYYRVGNGTKDTIKIKENMKLINLDTNEDVEIENSDYDYETEIEEGEKTEDSIKVKDQLKEGKYKLINNGYETEFEIR